MRQFGLTAYGYNKYDYIWSNIKTYQTKYH